MAITQEQADNAKTFHYPEGRACDSKQGPIRYRRMGKTQRWKRNTERFRIPTRYGLYNPAQITNDNQYHFHAEEDCPAVTESEKRVLDGNR